MSTTATEFIEHVVLLNVKDGIDHSQVTYMLNSLNGLKSLDTVFYLATGPVHQIVSTSNLKFTHLLHSRYKTKEDLAQYTAHEAHLDVVRSSVLPICDDIMTMDWVAHNVDGPGIRNPGSVMRVKFLKLKERVGESEKVEVINGLKEEQVISVGQNFTPIRAKGYSIGSIKVYPGISELDSLQEDVEIANKDFIDSLLVVDYVL